MFDKKIPNCGYIIIECNRSEIKLSGVDSIKELEWLVPQIKK